MVMVDQETKTSSSKGKFIVILISLIIGGVGGFIPMYLKSQDLEQQLAAVRQEMNAQADRLVLAQERLQVALLQNELGQMLLAVQEKNFGAAQKHSTNFFNRLRQVVFNLHDQELREPLQAILNRRDEITADLATLKPEIADKLRALYLNFPRVAPIGDEGR
ncbi:MAG: hypothetical protein D6723_05120 [Acidobacteria bacterium]|nr:MAG: hypothetical protein D6723_05120 [Acidobacteriota bacterium]